MKHIKNIVLDIGGIFFDDSKKNIEKLLEKNWTLYINLLMSWQTDKNIVLFNSKELFYP